MSRLWHDLQTHRRVVTLFGLLWIALWVVTVLTWWYDEAGYSAGMPGSVTLLHLLMPFAAGILAGWWQAAAGRGIKSGALSGLLVSAADMLVMYLWSAILLLQGKGQPDPTLTVWSALFEALAMGLFNCVAGLILGAVAGLIGGLVSAALHRTHLTHTPST